MPNWVFNKVYLTGDNTSLNKLKKFMTTKETCFDFNKILPMPEELNLESGSSETLSIECAHARKKHKTTCEEYERWKWSKSKTFDEWADLGEKYLSNLKKYGATTWYDWCYDNWGTKWNACDASWDGNNFVSFNTAWSCPEAIFEQMSKMFPNISFTVEYADEDLGSNCGTIEYSSNERSFILNPINSFEFACEVWGYDPEELSEEENEEEYMDY